MMLRDVKFEGGESYCHIARTHYSPTHFETLILELNLETLFNLISIKSQDIKFLLPSLLSAIAKDGNTADDSVTGENDTPKTRRLVPTILAKLPSTLMEFVCNIHLFYIYSCSQNIFKPHFLRFRFGGLISQHIMMGTKTVIFGASTALCFALLYQAFLGHFLFVTLGIAREHQKIEEFLYQCRRIQSSLLESCEDMVLDTEGRRLYAACSSLASGRFWGPG